MGSLWAPSSAWARTRRPRWRAPRRLQHLADAHGQEVFTAKYRLAEDEDEPRDWLDVLQQGDFLIRFLSPFEDTDDGTVYEGQGSVHSATLKVKDLSKAPLSALRRFIKGAGSATAHFCAPDGTAVQESLTLREYVALPVRGAAFCPLRIF
jgi:hypothetical protein